MTDQQLDDLVARIGDEMLTRLGLAHSPPLAHPCACDTEPLAAPAAEPAPSWIPAKIGLNCRDSRSTSAEIGARCLQARTLGLGAVSIFPSHVVAAGRVLRRTGVRLAVAVGWPYGATSTAAKALEAELALGQGADEIEVVVPAGALLAGEDDLLFGELKFIAEMTHRAAKTMTAVIENSALDQDRLIAACALSRLAGADAVCAAAGLAVHGPASAAAVRLFRKVVGQDIHVHTTGGVASEAAALNLAAAGADRVTIDFLPGVLPGAERA
ncbi:MAG: deoxyribose-phosphate aldolase [Acidobacteria bacterium]|nr:deoxyribose-phosphate aldolase [Acidobacteriota bacterium]MDA1236618.1 deoxyribose-phosphate aldolase [Acidobacteriota bacterium]